MEQMTIEERVLVIKMFYKNNASPIATVCALRVGLERNVAPKELSERRLIKKFETIGSLLN